ncbi:MAG: hypothetical protein ACE366_21170 [Bradymonadia bacterium]
MQTETAMEHMPEHVRARLAEGWLETALAEHASVASFARFTLHLLAAGAPPHLLEASHQAGLDEIKHARACFKLAARYRGEAMGPGPLPMSGDVLGPTDLPSLTAAAVIEGCVGETLSALEAAEAAQIATDAEVKSVLVDIAEEEGRHAELAWAFVTWAVQQGGEATRSAVTRAFAECEQKHKMAICPEQDPDADWLHAHGHVTDRMRFEVRVRGWREVVQPGRAALLG